MELGKVGLGRMGGNVVRRVIRSGPVPVLSAAPYQRLGRGVQL
jgi:6-phosphogluconate dehydrogenase (decarboxylating)